MEIQHPMVLAIGESAFKEGLDILPEYYSEEYKDNYKPVGMQLIWDTRHTDPSKGNVTREKLDAVANLGRKIYELWESGLSRQESVKQILPQILEVSIGKSH